MSKDCVKLTGAGTVARNGSYAPLIYMISTRIDEASINVMLAHLKLMCPHFNPTIFLTDKDLAVGNALETNFPNAHHRLCFIHVIGTFDFSFHLLVYVCKFILILFVFGIYSVILKL